jgi:ankyrin repeat protein
MASLMTNNDMIKSPPPAPDADDGSITAEMSWRRCQIYMHHGYTLFKASTEENLKAVECFVVNGADCNMTDDVGWNALHKAAENNKKNTEVIELLLTNMSLNSINKKDWEGYTPLDLAYTNNNCPIKQKIIDLIRSKGGKANNYDEKNGE